MSDVVKARSGRRGRRGRDSGVPSPVSGKRQVTLPVDVLREAGIDSGDLVWITSAAPGVITIERLQHRWDDLVGAFPGMYEGFDIDAERDAWQR